MPAPRRSTTSRKSPRYESTKEKSVAVVLRSFRGRSPLEPLGDLSRRCASVRDAIRNSHAAESAAGDEHSGMALEAPLDGGHPPQVTDLVLRVRPLPAIDARERRLSVDAD